MPHSRYSFGAWDRCQRRARVPTHHGEGDAPAPPPPPPPPCPGCPVPPRIITVDVLDHDSDCYPNEPYWNRHWPAVPYNPAPYRCAYIGEWAGMCRWEVWRPPIAHPFVWVLWDPWMGFSVTFWGTFGCWGMAWPPPTCTEDYDCNCAADGCAVTVRPG